MIMMMIMTVIQKLKIKLKSYNVITCTFKATEKNKSIKSIKLNQATSVYAIFRTDKLQKSLVYSEYGSYDLQIILNILEFGMGPQEAISTS